MKSIHRWGGALALAVLVTTGCASAPRKKTAVAWPDPPATTRIRHLRTLGSQADVESSASRLWRKVAGVGVKTHLYHPLGIAVTPAGDRVYVTDQALAELFAFDVENNKVERVPSSVIGGTPIGVALDAKGDIWVVVSERKVVLRFNPKLELVKTLNLEQVDRPTGLAVDVEAGKVFVADTSKTDGPGHCIRVYDLEGKLLTSYGQRGMANGEFLFPTFLTLHEGELFVADTMNARVQRLKADGTFVSVIGERGDRVGQFDKPKGIAFDTFGNLYVVDAFWSNVQIFNREGQVLLFFGGRGDSPGYMSNPSGIAIDGKNRIYVTNALNFRVDVYELVNTRAEDSYPAGTGATVAGTTPGPVSTPQ